MPNESPWLSTETIGLDNAAVSVKRGARNILTKFMEFVLRDSVLEVSLGLIIATSVTAVVNSLISDIVLPPLSLIPIPFMSASGSAGGLEEKFLVLRPGHGSIESYNTRAQAIEDGALILSYGAFADKLVNIIGLSLILFLFQASGVHKYLVAPESANEHSIKCPFCRKEISSKAMRCALCTSWLDGREDRETSALAPSP